ncbi:hypothetical protein RUND412_011497 [Rhizina undulata]
MSPEGSLPGSVVSQWFPFSWSKNRSTPERSAEVIKVFLTSRDSDDIMLQLEGVPNVYIQLNDNSGDIAAFVRTEVEKCISKKSLLRGSVGPELKGFIIYRQIRDASGPSNPISSKTSLSVEASDNHRA